MVTKTPNYQLIKPDQTDFYNVDDFNTNATIIDTELKKQSTKADNSWQKGVKNNVTVMNLGDSYAEKAIFFPNSSWKSTTNVEDLSITIPFDGSFSGLVKLSITAYWGGSDSHGGATALFQVGSYVGSGVMLNNMIIETISTTFARDFYINGATFSGTSMTIKIRKAPNAHNPITINLAVQGYATGTKSVFAATNETTVTATDTGSPTTGGYPWTPQIGRIPTATDFGKWNAGYDAYDRFQGNCKTITDWNTATLNGMYMGNGATNSPTNGWFMGITIAHNDLFIVQKAMEVTGNREFERQKLNGVWGAWIETSPRKLFQSVSNGKAAIANAITQMGVPTATDAEFAVMAANILNLSNIVSGTGTITSNGTQTIFAVSGLSFKPRAIMFRAFGGNVNAWGVYNGTWVADAFIVVIGGSSYGNTFSVFQGGFNVAAAFPNGSGQFYWWAIK